MSTTLEDTLMEDIPAETSAAPARPGLSLDFSMYEPYLADAGIPDDRRRELIETLWSIVVGFVDLGFDLHPVQQVEREDNLSSAFRVMLNSNTTINGEEQPLQEGP